MKMKCSVTLTSYRDASQQEVAFRSWDDRYIQLGRGEYYGYAACLDFGSVSVMEESINVIVDMMTCPPNGHLLLVLPLGSIHSHHVNGSLAPQSGFAQLGGNAINVVTEANSRWLMVLTSFACLPDLEPKTVAPLASFEMLPELRQTAMWLSGLIASSPEKLRSADDRIASVLPGLILDKVAEIYGQIADTGAKTVLRETYASEVCRKARRVVGQLGFAPLGVSELAREMRIPQHVLRQAFADSLGISPSVWLRQNRLNMVRRALLQMRENETSVTDVAMNHGFFHLGRFSAYYARSFGELPSKTLERVQRRSRDV